ncbi:hypothetical protein B4099_0493 [Heyndrickxia coagulans]|uniref:Uncharacterized protein n=1 Tax=Heyndrickxia coagulans TaxID=1398 RepID=A0A150KAU0_HEYCO|nr:hypothetical protein B4099_0493 [Heyndrickxia coagulans]
MRPSFPSIISLFVFDKGRGFHTFLSRKKTGPEAFGLGGKHLHHPGYPLGLCIRFKQKNL